VHEAEDYRGKLGLVFPPLSPDQAPAGLGANDQESISGGKTIRKYGRSSVPKGNRTVVQLAELAKWPAIPVAVVA